VAAPADWPSFEEHAAVIARITAKKVTAAARGARLARDRNVDMRKILLLGVVGIADGDS
jgi:hypothetical protein